MITFTQLGTLGRLGNQLFQYAALRSVSLEAGYPHKIANPTHQHWQGQDCLLHHFSLTCDYLNQQDLEQLQYRFMEQHVNEFYSEVFKIPDMTDLYGFFQNYKYFSKFETQIKKDFELTDKIRQEALECRQKIIEDGSSDKELVSVHMRRGDHTDGTNPESMNFYGENDVLTPESPFGTYFFKALEQFDQAKVKFVVFSGGSRKGEYSNLTDIEWCKENFNGDNVYYAENNSDLVDFALMSVCHHNITCHMTSFGWWAAFLNKNPNKIVIAPKNYTVPDDHRFDKGFYPPDWRII